MSFTDWRMRRIVGRVDRFIDSYDPYGRMDAMMDVPPEDQHACGCEYLMDRARSEGLAYAEELRRDAAFYRGEKVGRRAIRDHIALAKLIEKEEKRKRRRR